MGAHSRSLFQKTLHAKVAYGCSRNSTISAHNQSLFLKRLSVQKSPKGAAGIAINEVFSKNSTCKSRLRVQPEQHNKCTNIEVFSKRLSIQKPPTGAAGSTRVRNLSIQITVTYTQRGHHILHWLNFRDDTHIPVIEQHYPQFLTLKKISQLPFTYARPNR
jgi:hypothetical protein